MVVDYPYISLVVTWHQLRVQHSDCAIPEMRHSMTPCL